MGKALTGAGHRRKFEIKKIQFNSGKLYSYM